MSGIGMKTVHVGGLPVQVYTLGDLSQVLGKVVVLFLLHGRGGSAEQIGAAVRGVLGRVAENKSSGSQARDLVVVTFDQRNHGHRLLDKPAIGAWVDGNDNHAIDMNAMYVGTARDVSYLMDYIPAYIFPIGEAEVDQWLVGGISLGGHATWYALCHEPRVSLGIPIIGCPNYIHLITDRAKRSGVNFTPPIIPPTLLAHLKATDPSQFPYTASDSSNPFLGKKILVLSGKEDTLVPWASSDEVVNKLNVGNDGVKKVIVYPGVGHECTKDMIVEMADFVWEHALKA